METPKTDYENDFIATFKTMCGARNPWEAWTDFVVASACMIEAAVNQSGEFRSERIAENAACIGRLGGISAFSELLGILVDALEDNPSQDFLGRIFTKLELNNHWNKQFFTPYPICKLMAEVNVDSILKTIQEKGYASVNDPACGAGATLIAVANVLAERQSNYQREVFFVAQDIDRTVGLMCYVQLSLLGCPGYVVIADSLSNPLTGNVLCPCAKDTQEIWYTPMYFTEVWQSRVLFSRVASFIDGRQQGESESQD